MQSKLLGCERPVKKTDLIELPPAAPEAPVKGEATWEARFVGREKARLHLTQHASAMPATERLSRFTRHDSKARVPAESEAKTSVGMRLVARCRRGTLGEWEVMSILAAHHLHDDIEGAGHGDLRGNFIGNRERKAAGRAEEKSAFPFAKSRRRRAILKDATPLGSRVASRQVTSRRLEMRTRLARLFRRPAWARGHPWRRA